MAASASARCKAAGRLPYNLAGTMQAGRRDGRRSEERFHAVEQSGRWPLGIWGGPKGPWGSRPAIVAARRRPTSKTCCAAARTSSRACCRAAISAAAASLLIALGAVVLWGFSGFFRVEPDELGVVLRFGKYVREVAAGPELSPAVSDRDRADAEGTARQPDRRRHARRRRCAPRHDDARRAGREPDADRRREHRRRRLLGVLADQAERASATTCSTSRTRKAP